MSTPFRDDIEILGVSTRDNGDGTSTVSLVYRERPQGPKPAPRQTSRFKWPLASKGQTSTSQPDPAKNNRSKDQPNTGQRLPWNKIFLFAIAAATTYAVIMSIIRLN